MVRAEVLRSKEPHLIADVALWSTEDGGRTIPALPGWGCPLMVSKEKPLIGWDAWPLLGDTPLLPGDRRRLGFVFSNQAGIEAIRASGKFFLWEMRFIGEATVVE